MTNNRSNPIRELLDVLAAGHTLTAEDVRELPPLPDGVDRHTIESTLRRAAKQIASARASGANGRARQIARDAADVLIARAGEPLPERRDDDLPDDPRELAARIGRGW